MKALYQAIELSIEWSVFAFGIMMVLEKGSSLSIFMGLLLILAFLPAIASQTIFTTKKLVKQKENKEG